MKPDADCAVTFIIRCSAYFRLKTRRNEPNGESFYWRNRLSFNFAPKGWAFCNGQSWRSIRIRPCSRFWDHIRRQWTNHVSLPNLQGRVPIHVTMDCPGEQGARVTLTTNQIGHTHAVKASATATTNAAAGNFPAPSANNLYGSGIDTAMNAGAVSQTGGSQPHTNLQPYLVLNYIICLVGIFPSRN